MISSVYLDSGKCGTCWTRDEQHIRKSGGEDSKTELGNTGGRSNDYPETDLEKQCVKVWGG
jgi:hypothetical protein